MTLMATIPELMACAVLRKIDNGLEPDELELRLMYALPRFETWVANELPGLESTWDIETSPEEQLAQYLDDFVAGEALLVGRQFRTLNHISAGIWELKMADLRVFGWFPAKDCFIAVSGHWTEHVKRHNLYHGLAREAERERDQLALDHPKFVPGEDPNDVVSNYR
ncbi:MAG: hypothetical protein ABWZ27_06440 [Aestuariivirgaceae bacterium]